MNDAMTIALIGALATIISASIGAIATIRKDRISGTPGTPPPPLTIRRYSKEISVVAIGVLLACFVLVAGYIFGKSTVVVQQQAMYAKELAQETKSYASLVKEGLGTKDYVLPSVVMLVDLELSSDRKSISSDRHIIYELQALKEISDQPSSSGSVFVEEYHSSYNVARLPGADEEVEQEPKPTNKRWEVLFNVAKGERHTVVTGTHVSMPTQLPDHHKEHMFESLGSNEDAYCYPNYEGDVIGELVIIIQSHSLKLSLPTRGQSDAAIQHPDKTIQPIEARLHDTDDDDGPKSVVARFKELKKGEIAGLRLRWAPLKSQ